GVFEQGASRPYSEYFIPSPTSPEEELYRSELGKTIQDAMQELSPAHRAVISLRELDGMSYEEISDSLGCSVGTVMSRLHHARKKLCTALESLLGERPFPSKERRKKKDSPKEVTPVREALRGASLGGRVTIRPDSERG